MERQDAWNRTLLDAQLGKREIRVPGELRVPRPGDKPIEQPKVETSVSTIAAWFAKNR